MYGATLAEVIIRQHHGRAWLIIDQVVWDRALAQSMGSASATDVDESLHEDQRLQANQSSERMSSTAAQRTLSGAPHGMQTGLTAAHY